MPLSLTAAAQPAAAHPATANSAGANSAGANSASANATPQNLDWRYYGNDLANTRFQNVDQINPANVAGLKPAWIFHTGILDSGSSFENSPIVVNGTMFVSTGHDDVYALDAATGAQQWAYHPSDMPPLSQLNICCGQNSRGVAYGDGLIFLARLDDKLVALNAKTGAVAWETTVADSKANYTMTMAPQFADGAVIAGTAGADEGTRGQVVAYDALTGHLRWRFYTTQPGTWGGDAWKTGGASAWGNPTVDKSLGLVYVGTGNAGPDLYGGTRSGLDLYSASLVAIDLRTGQLRWAFQEVHHDLWDYDGPQPATLFDVRLDGRSYPAIGHCNKDGNYFILDRTTGRPLFPVKEVPVPTQPSWQDPWPTQPVSAVQPLSTQTVTGPVGPGITAAPEFTPPQQRQFADQPGGVGGCTWPPGAYSPRTGDVYYAASYFPFVYTSAPVSAPTNTGGSAEQAPAPGVQQYSFVGATSTRTGKVTWRTKFPQIDSSSMAVGGNLLFFGTDDEVFHAVNAATGAPLWSFDGSTVTNAGGADAPPAIYVVNGREYVVEAFGGNFNDRFSTTSPVGDALIAFALPDGSATSTSAAAVTPHPASAVHLAATGSAQPTGGTWDTMTDVPGIAALNKDGDAETISMSCTTAVNCAAGGEYEDASVHLQAFVVTETDGKWGTAIEVPGTADLNKSGSAWVNSVSCKTTGNCAAGGAYVDGAGHQQAFVVTETDGKWGTAIEVPGTADLNKSGLAEITSVSCATAGNCSAGGKYEDASHLPQAFVVTETDGTWDTAIEIPGTAALNTGGNAETTSVSCSTAGNCAAGGSYEDASHLPQAFVVTETDGTWDTAIEVPGTAALNTGGNAETTSVSCSTAGNCSAGGSYEGASVQREAFVVSETDGKWGTAIEVPGSADLNKSGNAEILSVSCASAGNCAAGGDYEDASFLSQALVVSETDGKWGTAIEVPGTAELNKSGLAEVTSVSCRSAGNCAAGGKYLDASFHNQAWVVTETGGTWATAIQVPGTAARNLGGIAQTFAVSCTAGNCAAGGEYEDAADHFQAFVVSGS
ncbi:MAG TPA: PQQ-binding-like beta-propeller repeat protein [Streptosporangiaceae bacterium]